jgi:SAM-dependent methyltransferase
VKASRNNPYETERYLQEYLLFHYGEPADVCPFEFVPRPWLHFHERLRTGCLLPQRSRGRIRALDLGCGVGRFSFELGLVAGEVLGIDYSQAFIRAARTMAAKHSVSARVPESGELFRKQNVVLPPSLRRANVRFDTGDAMDLRRWAAEPFQIVAAINLLCRLPSPRQFLATLPSLVAPGGQLLLASPFSWLQEYTPPGQWLTSREVERLLRGDFELLRRRDLPFVIREHRRKYQLVISEALTFRRT